jgi:hypothetical protein
MADVFISYSKADAAAVRRLADAVRRLGYDVWWDEELPAHLSYSDVIAEKIESAKAAIVVWSESAAASQWVRAEADLARNQRKLIQASFDGRLPPMPFNQIQCAALGDWKGEDGHQGWEKVKASLTALVGPRVPVAAAPPAPARPGKPRLALALAAPLTLAVAAAGYLLWPRGAPAPVAPPPAAAPAPRIEPPPAPSVQAAPVLRQEAKAAPARAARRPRDLWRYCAGAARRTRECAAFRERYARIPRPRRIR